MDDVGTRYTVQPGDCVESVADAHGLFWETIWNHPDNSALKRARKNPNILLPGDELFIPNIRCKEEAIPTGARHTFLRRGVPSHFELRLLQDDQPRVGVSFVLVTDGITQSGTTDSEGRLRIPIPPGARTGELRLDGGREVYAVQLGQLDPTTELSGVQHRLRNLGFDCEPTGLLDEATRTAIAAFQNKYHLNPTGLPDDVTHHKLVDLYGS
jgi:hypothetical protein